MSGLYLFGASGHGRVIKEIVEACGNEVIAFVDDNITLNKILNVPVLHKAAGLSPLIVSVGNNAARKRIVSNLSCDFITAVHPTAVISPTAVIGEGTVVMAGAVVNAGAVIGRHCIVNTGASIDHDCVVEDYCHIAPHATLCGGVKVGEGTLIGVGVSIIPCIEIGQWCTVGAGAAVITHINNNMTVVGVPATPLFRNGKRIE